MAESTLFNKETQKRSYKFVVIFAVLLIAVFGSAYGFYRYATFEPEITEEQILQAKMRDAVVMMLAQPRFSGEQFREQILGKARLQRYLIDKKDVYFSTPETSDEEFAEIVGGFIISRERIVFAEDAGEKLKIDKLSLRKTPETGRLFKTSLENVKFDAEKRLEFPYEGVNYNLTMRELVDFYDNSQIYGGKIAAATNPKIDGKAIMFGNHGAFVSKPDEPSMKRFVAEILKGAENETREVKIQKLLDFVTNQIEYDYYEALGNYETLKRPSETLMTRRSDCSNKTILMASMLEQIGEDYILLYCPRHITVAVPQGDYPVENNLGFKWDGKNYIVAETTLPGFQIGKTKVAESLVLNTVNYVQRPKNTEIIFEAQTFRPLEFR